jgi:hypothetical protein
MTTRNPATARSTVLFSAIVLVASCSKKSDPASAGAAQSAAPLAVAAPTSLSDFEGDITLVAKSAKERRPVPPITLTVKGNKMRFDLPEGMEAAPRMGEHAYAIVDTGAKKLDVVVDEQKMVMEMDLATMGEQLKKLRPPEKGPADNNTKSTVTKTGHTDTVAGIQCEDWDFTNEKGERGRVCVSSQNAPWLSIPSLGLPSEHLWAKDLLDGQHLPLRMIGYDAAGAEDSRLEVTKVERKAVLDSSFAIPAGYRTMDFTQMMTGMQGMMAGMMNGPHHGAGMPGFPSALPPGAALPPGMALPSNLPPGVTLPKNAAEMMKQLQERAKAAGVQLPPPGTQPPPAR